VKNVYTKTPKESKISFGVFFYSNGWLFSPDCRGNPFLLPSRASGNKKGLERKAGIRLTRIRKPFAPEITHLKSLFIPFNFS